MGYRLSKIYTRTGDKGTTGLGDGRRVDKDSARIEAIGTIDELNCLIGILITHSPPAEIEQLLTAIQHRLFDLGGELAMPGHNLMSDQSVTDLEQELDKLNENLPPLQEFILPAGNRLAASCHHARAVCRRAERRLTQLARDENEAVNQTGLKYLNRLSDLLFVIARVLARQDGGNEVYWRKDI
ncbi:cob(I)yrinic acid a,c-diamide adenosyltransferase [Sedimenticola thiotaurini]|uniref:Corrinoid adenosyltransferase n=1 Tax=Sedimenticola thiotaurini TaxID=1543721 RepID=A0A0F7K1K3_9GAMM|nr:cob(I)yrinic acid a,c-diamide adenosyltransferase [Sedimenticola thiotaurini]AKH21454.1 ATP--cobalamin adenosyltransferase [Sedimenticola thiotaurini]